MDVRWVIRSASRAAMWPIDGFVSAKATRGVQPTGTITIEAPRSAAWVTASGLMAAAGGPGAQYVVECFLDGRSQPWQMGIVEGADIVVAPGRDSVALTADAVWSWAQRARLIWGDEDQEAIVDAVYTDRPDDLIRDVWRDHMVAPTVMPAGHPSASRALFGSWTIAVEADTGSHPTSIEHHWDAGRNVLLGVLEIADKYALRCYWTVSGSTLTMKVAYPYSAGDKTFATTGQALSDARGSVLDYTERADYSSIRNVWCVRDGTARYWANDATSETTYGLREDVLKMTIGGGAVLNTQMSAEATALLAAKDPVRAVTAKVGVVSGWSELITHYGIANSVSIVNEALGTYVDVDVLGMEVAETARGVTVSLAVRDERRSYLQEAWRRPGPVGGFGAATRFFDFHG